MEYLVHYWQPLSGLAIGTGIFASVGYINWIGTNKTDAIKWIAKNIFRDGFRSGEAADGLFMVVTAMLFATGCIMIGGAFLFLGQ
jgi:hypothetical protein